MKSEYFKIQELVSKNVYNKYGESAWRFIDEKLILSIDAIREYFNQPVTINNWMWGGNLQQRGLRANKDDIVSGKKDYYISQHCLGKAVDLNIRDFSIKEIYDSILQNKDKFPYITRIENIKNTPTWIHIDVANTESDSIEVFNG